MTEGQSEKTHQPGQKIKKSEAEAPNASLLAQIRHRVIAALERGNFDTRKDTDGATKKTPHQPTLSKHVSSALPRPEFHREGSGRIMEQIYAKQLDRRADLFLRRAAPEDPTYQKINTALAEACEYLGFPPGYFRFDIVEDDEPNDMLFHGANHIFITHGMLEVQKHDFEKTMATLFHELGHYILGSQKQHRHEGGSYGSTADIFLEHRVSGIEEEYKCDQFALLIGNELGYSLSSTREAFEAIRDYEQKKDRIRLEEDEMNIPWIVYTHPGTERRIQNLRRVERKLIEKSPHQAGIILAPVAAWRQKQRDIYLRAFRPFLEEKQREYKEDREYRDIEDIYRENFAVLKKNSEKRALTVAEAMAEVVDLDRLLNLDVNEEIELEDLPKPEDIAKASKKTLLKYVGTMMKYLRDPDGQAELTEFFEAADAETLEKLFLSFRAYGKEEEKRYGLELLSDRRLRSDPSFLSTMLTLLFRIYALKVAGENEFEKIRKTLELYKNLAELNFTMVPVNFLFLLYRLEEALVTEEGDTAIIKNILETYLEMIVTVMGRFESLDIVTPKKFPKIFSLAKLKTESTDKREKYINNDLYNEISNPETLAVQIRKGDQTYKDDHADCLVVGINTTWRQVLDFFKKYYRKSADEIGQAIGLSAEKIDGLVKENPLEGERIELKSIGLTNSLTIISDLIASAEKVDPAKAKTKIEEFNASETKSPSHKYTAALGSAEANYSDKLEYTQFRNLPDLYTPEEIYDKYLLRRRELREHTSYTEKDLHAEYAQNYETWWHFSEFSEEIKQMPVDVFEKLKQFTQKYVLKNSLRDQHIFELAGWGKPLTIEDIQKMNEQVKACTDMPLLSVLLHAVDNPLIVRTISLRLDELGKNLPPAELVTRYDASAVATSKQICEKLELDFDEFAAILLPYPFKSYERDALLKPLIEAAPTVKKSLKIAELLRVPPINATEFRQEGQIIVSESFLDVVSRMDALSKQEILLSLLGKKQFFSTICFEEDLDEGEAKELKEKYLFSSPDSFTQALKGPLDLIETKKGFDINRESPHAEWTGELFGILLEPDRSTNILRKKISNELNKKIKTDSQGEDNDSLDAHFRALPQRLRKIFEVEEPDSVIVASQAAGISLDMLLEESEALTSADEQIDMLEQILIGKNGALLDKNAEPFLRQIAELFIEHGKFAEAMTPEKKTALVKIIEFSLLRCPRHKVAELFHALWTITRKGNVSIPEIVCHIIQIYGPLMIKAGQYLGSQSDLPEEWREEFKKLTDKNKQSDKLIFLQNIDYSYEKNPFTEIGSKEGEGSLAAVYEGKIGERKVAIKALHPWIANNLESDRNFLDELVEFINQNHDLYKTALPQNLGAVANKQVADEIDTNKEMRNNFELTEVLANREASAITIEVPKVIPELRTKFMYVMEFVEGVRIDEEVGMAEMGIEPAKVQGELATEIFRQILVEGIFHADPNLGNFRVQKQAEKIRIGMLDTGHIVHLSAEKRYGLKKLLRGFLAGDSEAIATSTADLILNPGIDTLEQLKGWTAMVQAQNLDPNTGIKSLFEFCNTHGLLLKEHFIQIVKTLGIMNPLLRHVDTEKLMEFVMQ